MEFIRFETGKDDEGRRLDRIAKKLLSEENLSQLYKALRNGLIKVNEKKQKGEYRNVYKKGIKFFNLYPL